MQTNGIWTNSYPIHTFMCGAERKIRLTSICHCLQEVAGEHAAHYNLGYEGMQENQQAWVLNRLRVEVEHYLNWKETLHVQTWVQLMRGPFSQRMFLLLDDAQRVIGSASTFWVVLNTETHKLQRLTANADTLPVLSDKMPSCGMVDKLSLPDNMTLLGRHTVQHSDLDLLHHVNNVKYLEWILDICSATEQQPARVDLNFTKETKLGEKVSLYKSDDYFQLKSGDEQEVCKARVLYDRKA